MNTKQLNRIFARAMYGMVIVAMVFSVSAVTYAAPESSKLQTDGPPALAWLQVTEDGFGDSQNQQIPSLAVFGGYLYAGTWNAVWEDDNVVYATAQIWRTPDGANWELVNETEANGAAALIVYKGYLYTGSWSNEEWGWDGKIWRSKDGVNWDPVDGFTSGNGIARFAVFKNALYASTWDAGTEIWRTTNGVDWKLFAAPGWDYENNGGAISSEVFNGYLYWGVPNWTTGAQIWRTDGVSMEPITTDGFGTPENSAIPSLAAFNDYLYAGVWNSQGVQVWRSISGTDWEQVSEVGSPSTGNTNNALEVYDEQLYLVVENDSTGLEVWRTANGIDWEQVGFAGFGDGNNQWSYWDNATTVFKGNLFIATNNFATGGEVWELCPTGCKNAPVGDRISIFNGGEMEFPAETPFHIMHGFQLSSDESAYGIYDFELEVDGILQKEDFKIFWKEDGDSDILRKLWVYNFLDGMTGTHEFTGHWFEPCQYATGYTDPCPTPNAKVETRTQTLIVNFVLPPLNLRVNYGDDWVESFYEAGHEVVITVTDEDGNVKGTVTEWTEPKDFWGWEEGFQTGWSDWVDAEGNPLDSPPDIQPKDWVYGDVDNGVNAQVQIGEINGFIDLASDSVEGTVLAPWFSDEVEVDVECHPWGASEPVDMKYDSVLPDGEDSYSCSWMAETGTEWDIQPGQVVGVSYFGLDGHWVANVITNPQVWAFPEVNQIFGYGWPRGSDVSLTINGDYFMTVEVEGAPWDENDIMAFFDLGEEHDLVTGDVIQLSGSGMDRIHTVQYLTVTDVDWEADTVTGQAENGMVVHAWVHGFGQDVWLPVTDEAWTANFGSEDFHLQLGMCGRAEIRVEGYNSTNVDWCVPNTRFTVWPEWNYLEGYEWPDSAVVSISVAGKEACSTDATSAFPEWNPSNTFFSVNFPEGCAIEVGDFITLSYESLSLTHQVQELAITEVDLNSDTVAGTAAFDPDQYILHTWIHGVDESYVQLSMEGGNWLADFGSQGINLQPGMGGRVELVDQASNATAVDWYVPNPHFSAFPEWEYLEGYEWPDGALVSISVDGKEICSTSATAGYPEWDPNNTFLGVNFPEGCDLAIGDVVTASDGVTTRTHTVRNLTISSVDEVANAVAGMSDPDDMIYVWPHETGQQIEVAADEYGSWLADFNGIYDIRPGSGGRSEVRDESGNATAVDWYIPNPHFSAFPEWEYLEGYEWPDGALVSISVDSKDVCSTSATAGYPEWDPNNTFLGVNFPEGCDLAIGDVVTASDGVTTRTHTVRNLTISSVDEVANTVAGMSDPDEMIYVWPHETGQQIEVTADEYGSWLADFNGVYDIQPGSGGRSEIRDESGNATAVDWYVPNPRFTIFPEWEWFDGYDWPDGAAVSITVTGKSECATTSQESWGGFFNGGFPEGCDIAVDDFVTFTYGETTRNHTVQNVAITEVNKEASTVSGTADADLVYAWVHGYGYDMELQVEDGTWLADFGSAGLTLVEGMGGRAEVRDEFGNGTAVDWYIPNPRIVVQITDDWFRAEDFTPNAELTFWIYESEGGELLRHPENTWQLDDSGYVTVGMWELEEYIDLVPGNYVVVSDGEVEKELVLEDFTFDVFDLTNGHLQGTAPEPFGRPVWVGIGIENEAWTMDINTDVYDGSWFADFGQPVPSEYQWVAAQIFDSDGDASELRPASEIIFLRPQCGDIYTVQTGSMLEIRYGSWVAIGEDLAIQNAEHLNVELVLNGETVTGTQQPVVPRSEIPCGTPLENAYGVYYVASVDPLNPGTYVATVTWSFDEEVTDGYDTDGDGVPESYGPGVVGTREFTIIVP